VVPREASGGHVLRVHRPNLGLAVVKSKTAGPEDFPDGSRRLLRRLGGHDHGHVIQIGEDLRGWVKREQAVRNIMESIRDTEREQERG
jgi:hypothetical protein